MNLKPSTGGRLVAPLAIVAAIAVAGCGSGSTSAATKATSQDAARVKLTQCLRQQGVNVPDSGGGAPQNFDPSKFQAALKACRKYQQGAFGNVSPSQQQQFQDSFAKFSSCMRQHGVEIPTFTPGSGPPAGGAQINPNDPKVKAAMQACQSKLGNVRGAGGGPLGGGG